MASISAMEASPLASAYWKDNKGNVHIRVYYQDRDGNVCQVKWDDGTWAVGSDVLFKDNTLRGPIAAIVYPDTDSDTASNIPGPNPEIHIFYIDLTTNPAAIREIIKPKDSEVWTKVEDAVPTYCLAVTSGLAASEYQDPHIRVYYQDTDGYIRESSWDSATKKWTGGTDDKEKIISEEPALTGTAIAAGVGVNYTLYPVITIIWQDPDHNLAGTFKSVDWQMQETTTPIEFPTSYPVNDNGSISVASWNNDKTLVYYEGVKGRVQKVTYEWKTKTWEGPHHALKGSLFSSASAGRGSLASAAFVPQINGSVGSLFYQPVGDVSVVEIAI
ncbi:hypothetical protein SISNIDRAFT_452722 [Sistotremastrum niveocremeum HHB9708]|uniref:Fucose-specific lectin n=1 Tax=Sistotremastrum niveocremeum HHB9708 TaxID=1314777 RepID=A0A164WSY4_9AGAM|nr:hypothetical protein SISNIDRAFT_452722 [Sistotremastrum niveocremeum HHB9708]